MKFNRFEDASIQHDIVCIFVMFSNWSSNSTLNFFSHVFTNLLLFWFLLYPHLTKVITNLKI